nr:unnamed protein product [Naegleria fowleri]
MIGQALQDPFLIVNIISHLPLFYQHVLKRVSKTFYQIIQNDHHDHIMENYYNCSSLEMHDLKLVELNDYFKFKLHFKMQYPIQVATLLKKMYYLDDHELKWMDKYRKVGKYQFILNDGHCLSIHLTLVGCDHVTCQYLHELENQFRDHSIESVNCLFSQIDFSDAWQYDVSCHCYQTSVSHQISRRVSLFRNNEQVEICINKKSPKIKSLEGFNAYFKKCATNLGICVSLLPKAATISHQLFTSNGELDWNQALFVFRNKLISTCEPTLLAPSLNPYQKHEICTVYSFLFNPVKKLALDTYLRTTKPQLFIKEYQNFLQHDLVHQCQHRFQELLEIAKENEHEVHFILSKQFSTTPLYILEELDALTLSKHKELCKQLNVVQPKIASKRNNKQKMQQKKEINSTTHQETDLSIYSFKKFQLFHWRNDLLLKALNISEEEFHTLKQNQLLKHSKRQHEEDSNIIIVDTSRGKKKNSSSSFKNSFKRVDILTLGDFNLATCKDYYYNDYYCTQPFDEEDNDL